MCKVSVVVPVYNVEKYLDQCVESILAQTFGDFELILVDDGSPDSCPAMCDAWAEKDPRVHVIHKENGGANLARKAGAEIAAGEYIAFIDSDDWVEPSFLQVLYDGITGTGSDIAQCNMQRVEDTGKTLLITAGEQRIFESDSIRCVLLEDLAQQKSGIFTNSMCNKMYKTFIVKAAADLCPKAQVVGEDYLLNFAAAALCGRIAVLNTAALYNYRHNTSSVTGTYTPRKRLQERNFWQATYDIANFAQCKNLPDVELMVQRAYVSSIYECAVSGRSFKDKRQEIKSILSDIEDRKAFEIEATAGSFARRLCLNLVFWGLTDVALLLVDARKSPVGRSVFGDI